MENTIILLRFKPEIVQDRERYLAVCHEFNLVGIGSTIGLALEDLYNAVLVYYEQIRNMNQLEETLHECGIQVEYLPVTVEPDEMIVSILPQPCIQSLLKTIKPHHENQSEAKGLTE